jgi:hypothetical protein
MRKTLVSFEIRIDFVTVFDSKPGLLFQITLQMQPEFLPGIYSWFQV